VNAVDSWYAELNPSHFALHLYLKLPLQNVLKDLEMDIRKMMSPNTAAKLRESKRNVLKDFVHVAGPLGITHLMMLSATQNAAYLRIAKSPRGPTITLRIHAYSLVRDILASQQRPRAPQSI